MPVESELRKVLDENPEVTNNHMVMKSRCDGAWAGGGCAGRHSVSPLVRTVRTLRQSGRAVGLAALLAMPAWSQQQPLELDLRSGKRLLATSLSGSEEAGFTASVAGNSQRLAPGELLAIRVARAVAPELLRVDLVGGDRLYGAIAGGDADGEDLELLSPVIGKVRLPIDRIAAVVQPGVHPSDQVLPEGVDEALFVPTGRGFDLVAGTLYRFGPQGIRFQPEGAQSPSWYSPRRVSSLRLRGGLEREQQPSAVLLTRAADRIGLKLSSCDQEGLQAVLETGQEVTVRWRDVACVCLMKDVVHLSTLAPTRVVESGFDSEITYSWRRDRCAAGGELLAQSRAYGLGLGVMSRSRITFRVPERATHFRASVAFDDTAVELPVRAHAVARVLKGNRLLFEADDLTPGQQPRDVGMHAVEVGDTITLEVDFGRGRDIGDRVNWLLPMFLMRSQS